MDFLIDQKEIINLVIITIPSLLVTGLTLIFYYQQIGTRIEIAYSINHDRLSAERITPIILVNKKNKPVAVYRIHIIADKKYFLKLKDFSPPLVINPLSSVSFDIEPKSLYLTNNEPFKPDFHKRKLAFWVTVNDNNLHRCKVIGHPSCTSAKVFEKYILISTHNSSFNGLTYTPEMKYAVTYLVNGIKRTAFIDDYGFLNGQWDLPYNSLPTDILQSRVTIQECLRKYVKDLVVDNLRESNKHSSRL